MLGDVLANVSSVVFETVAAGSSRLGSPGGRGGLVSSEAAAGSRCKRCQLEVQEELNSVVGRTSRSVVPASHVDGRKGVGVVLL